MQRFSAAAHVVDQARHAFFTEQSADRPRAMAPIPISLVDGVENVAVEILGITKLRHRSALTHLSDFDGPMLVETIHRTIENNYARGCASANKDRSRENWRWPVLQPQISEHNRSPEVVVERAIAAACKRLDRTDWANQVPVASGLIASGSERRRAIDLVHRRGERHFELIELKIASDTPLYAAIEIILYGCIWLIARSDKPSRESALLDGDHIDLRVLAPTSYYAPYVLRNIEATLEKGVRALGQRHGITLTFAFQLLDKQIQPGTFPDDQQLLALLDHPRSATAMDAQ